MKYSQHYRRVAKFSSLAALVAFLAYASVGLAALTFNATTITSDGVLTLTGAASSTWDLGSGNTLSIQTTNGGPVTFGGGTITAPTLVFTNATGTTATSTFGVNTAKVISLSFTNATGTTLFTTTASSTGFGFGNATGTSLLTVTASSTSLGWTNATGTTLTFVNATGTTATITTLVGTTVSSTGTFAISATGTPIVAHLSGTGSIGFGTLTSSTCQQSSFTLTGVTVGDTVYVGVGAPSTTLPGFMWSAYVSSTDTVAVRGCNAIQTSITVPTGTWRADVWKH